MNAEDEGRFSAIVLVTAQMLATLAQASGNSPGWLNVMEKSNKMVIDRLMAQHPHNTAATTAMEKQTADLFRVARNFSEPPNGPSRSEAIVIPFPSDLRT